MKILQINSLCGIKNQMYDPTQVIHAQSPVEISNGFFDINSLFWTQIFELQQVEELIQCAALELSQDKSPKIQAIINAPELFLSVYSDALQALDGAWNDLSEERLFSSLETLEMVCILFSRLKSAPFHLTISEGYVLSRYSALDMEQTCLLPFCNPYLNFINEMILPQILEYNPDVLILSGSINLASFAIAKYMRKIRPDIFIVAADCETDYYSFKKISKLLVHNSALFSVYHCLVLKNLALAKSEFQRKKKITSVDLEKIPNLIYSLDGGNTIQKTTSRSSTTYEVPVEPRLKDHVYNLKAFQGNHCFWNRCSFCGINSKYSHGSCIEWDIPSAASMLEQCYAEGINRFWFLDEAIPTSVLKGLCEEILARKLRIVWHVRTRIDPSLIALADLLYAAGLRHIIFGLESASERVLGLMEKTSGDFDYLDVAEQIVREFSSAGIQVHFSSILGFPTESEAERNETILFLEYLQKHYSLFSYNVNIFYLDIGSKIYRRWDEYDITGLSFPCSPKFYLGNDLDWIGSTSSGLKDELEKDQYTAMAHQYIWYPEGALIEPNIFYSFWEYGRFALLRKPLYQREKTSYPTLDTPVKINPKICFCPLGPDLWLMYHFENHHFAVGGAILNDLMTAAQKRESIQSILLRYPHTHREAAMEVILQLYNKGFFA